MKFKRSDKFESHSRNNFTASDWFYTIKKTLAEKRLLSTLRPYSRALLSGKEPITMKEVKSGLDIKNLYPVLLEEAKSANIPQDQQSLYISQRLNYETQKQDKLIEEYSRLVERLEQARELVLQSIPHTDFVLLFGDESKASQMEVGKCFDKIFVFYKEKALLEKDKLQVDWINVTIRQGQSISEFSAYVIKLYEKLQFIDFAPTDSKVVEVIEKNITKYRPSLMGVLIDYKMDLKERLLIKTETGEDQTTEDEEIEYGFRRLLLELESFEKTLQKNDEFKRRDGMNPGHLNYMKRKDKVTCYKCGKQGHFARDCRSKPREEEKDESKDKHGKDFKDKYPEKKDKKEEKEDKKRDIKRKGSPPKIIPKFNHMLCSTTKKESVAEFFLDSCASYHVTNRRDLLHDYEEIEPFDLYLGGSVRVIGRGKGTAIINGIKFGNVHYVPGINVSCLSVGWLNQNLGIKVVFDGTKGTIYYEEEPILTLQMKDYVYGISGDVKMLNAATSNGTAELWHRRLAHCGMDRLERFVEHFDLKIDTGRKIKCESCIIGKHAKKIKKKATRDIQEVLNTVSTDIMGPIEEESRTGKRYAITFLDHGSGYAALYTITTKSDALECFKRFKATHENLTGKKIKVVRSDNAKEYGGEQNDLEFNWFDSEFDEFCNENGIIHERSDAYCPEQNGKAERYNRTLGELTRTLLNASGLDKTYWSDAMLYVNFVWNRLPKADGRIPFEVMFNRKVDTSFFKPFGCKCFVHIPKEKRKKLDDKSEVCIFLGCNEKSKTYVVQSLTTWKVYKSSQVIFWEDEFPARDWNSSDESKSEDEEQLSDSGESDASDDKEVTTRRVRFADEVQEQGLDNGSSGSEAHVMCSDNEGEVESDDEERRNDQEFEDGNTSAYESAEDEDSSSDHVYESAEEYIDEESSSDHGDNFKPNEETNNVSDSGDSVESQEITTPRPKRNVKEPTC